MQHGHQIWGARAFGLALLALTSLGSAAPAQTAETPGVVVVQPEQRAVLSGPDGQLEVLEAGLHAYDASTQEVAVYDTAEERNHLIPQAFTVGDCPVDVTVVYNIGDVRAFHVAGADLTVIERLDGPLKAFAASQGFEQDMPGSDVAMVIYPRVRDIPLDGLRLRYLTVDLGDCGPPKLVHRDIPIETPDWPVATGGAHRSHGVVLHGVTADDLRLVLSGGFARFDEVDEGAPSHCFGSPEDAGPWVDIVLTRALRQVLSTVPEGEVMARLDLLAKGEVPLPGMEELGRCGLVYRGVDFHDLKVQRQETINCREQPNTPECPG